MILPHSVIEFCLKDDALGDPFITDEHISVLGLCHPAELQQIKDETQRINDFLFGLFAGVGIRFVDCKLEFGRIIHDHHVEIVLADEISPDSCRLWDLRTQEVMDKDVFRKDIGSIKDAYRKVAHRLGIVVDKELEAEEAKRTQDH